MKVFWGMCGSCVRYNPKAKAHCILAKDVGDLQRKHAALGDFKLMVCDCYLHLPIEEVFPEEEPKEEVVEEKPKKKTKKKKE